MIFVSIDGNQDAFERNYSEMPWTALPFQDEQRKQNLKQEFRVIGIPALIILDKKGHVVSQDGRKDIYNHSEQAFDLWLKSAN